MAGGWIKVEKSTIRKSEVTAIARLLGVTRHHALGLLVEFWAWVDDMAVDGVVDACVDADVDATFATPGFAAALAVVNWIKFDRKNELTGRAIIPNADRYFGESLKKRALASERQARWRAKHVDAHVDAVDVSRNATPSTRLRPDKTRLNKTTSKPKSKAIARVPLAAPTDEHQRIAQEAGVSCADEWAKYRDWLAANGRSHKDEVAGFRNWLRRATTYARPRVVGKQHSRDNAASAIFGDGHGKHDERVIDGQAERVA